MNIFKQSFQLFKKNILKITLSDLSLIILILAFVFIIRRILTYYLLKLDSFQVTLDNVDALLPQIQSLAVQYFIIYYISVPLVIFLLWSFFQGLDYSSINKNFNLKYLLNFALLSLPLFTLFFIFIYLLLKAVVLVTMPSISTLALSPKLTLYLLIILFVSLTIISYITLIIYSVLDSNILKTIKKSLKISYKKFLKLFPLFFLISILSIILLVVMFYYSILSFTGLLTLGTLITHFILILILIIILAYLRILFVMISKS